MEKISRPINFFIDCLFAHNNLILKPLIIDVPVHFL